MSSSGRPTADVMMMNRIRQDISLFLCLWLMTMRVHSVKDTSHISFMRFAFSASTLLKFEGHRKRLYISTTLPICNSLNHIHSNTLVAKSINKIVKQTGIS